MPYPSTAAGGGNPSSRRLRILVVDDDHDGRVALGILLRQAGMEVALAESVPEARRSLERMAPDAVLSDLVMPEEDGFALRGALRAKETEIGRHIPMLVISALSDPEIQRRAADEGFDAYFVKPCDFQELFEEARPPHDCELHRQGQFDLRASASPPRVARPSSRWRPAVGREVVYSVFRLMPRTVAAFSCSPRSFERRENGAPLASSSVSAEA